ncbi:hypothetical protein SAMN06269185_2908 [Natronoarchaeum philippinense]|uniref:Sugar-specific transcriptional regulator TrmB n=1 Tax=Natronoarchaeum philippinense TaxID=558529 RepID=A0A285PBD3_NATPI|nr:hypothetical protein [Natronoarchaeum philippinense]SNZ17171.1 hypothetical protein SAMN06269185_2908 [Natronoarchaeum philippinense]
MQQPGVTPAGALTELESPRAKLVYLYLSMSGWSTVSDIQHALGLQKIALLSILDTLDRNEFVERSGDAVRCRPT